MHNQPNYTKQLLTSRICKAIQDHIMPGIGMIYGNSKHKEELYVGNITYESNALPVSNKILYDVASITKLYTAATIMHLITNQKLSLDDSIGDILNAPALKNVKIFHCMCHASGIYIGQFSSFKNTPEKLRSIILKTPPIIKPGTKYFYYNGNYYLLGMVVEKLTKLPIDKALHNYLFMPLGMKNTLFCPPKSKINHIAPTEFDPWRKRLIQGEVHDESSYALGKITGYAGAFSTIKDLFTFALLYLNYGQINTVQYIDKQLLKNSIKTTFKKATKTPVFNARHGYSAFRINARKRIGKHASQHTYEFSGFTGPAMIIDPDRNLAVAFVDNRIYPKRPDNFNASIQFRADLFDILCKNYPVKI